MDLVKAKAEARNRNRSYIDQVDDWSQAQLTDHVLPQDRAQRFDPGVLSGLRSAGLLSLELDPFRFGAAGPAPLRLPNDGMEGVAEAIRGLSRTDPAVAVLVHVHNVLTARCILRFGTEAQKARWLPELAQERIGAFAATEAQAGSDLARMNCELTPDPVSGGYRLNGEKYWITNAAEAGVFLVLARLGSGSACALIRAEAPGLTVGPRIDKMSMRASSTCAVLFENVAVAEEDILGGAVGGMDVAMYGLVSGRVGIAAQMLGLAEGALRRCIDYARKREAFGAAILRHQGVSFPLAQLRAEIAAVELTMQAAARRLDATRNHMSALELANIAKLLASQLAERAAGQAVETLGGNGVAEAHAVEKFYRDAKVGKIYEGTVNILLRAIASNLDERRSA